MPRQAYIFETNHKKSQMQVTVNSVMMASLLFVLRFLWSSAPDRFGPLVMSQVVLAIPMLFVSSLVNVKLSHWKGKEAELWEFFAWFTTNMGNIFIFNAIGLLTAAVYPLVAKAYFLLLIFLMALYSLANVYYKPRTLGQKMFKFAFFTAGILLGGFLPVATLL